MDLIFRVPPKHPDARDIYLGGIGLLTAFRGLQYIFGTPPTAAMFVKLGPIFTSAWSWIWVVCGIGVVAVACTGHRWPEVDRLAGFGLMMIWWMWAGIYALSGIFFPGERRAGDLLIAVGLFMTGIVMSAGVIQGIRKTQELALRKIAMDQIRGLEQALAEITSENQRLRREAGNGDG